MSSVRVPEDVAVVGFDNTAFAGSPAFSLTTYEQPMDTMVEAVLDMIMERRPSETVHFPGA